MEQPLWILLPWTGFVIAAGIKVGRLGTGVARQLEPKTAPREPIRQTLERIWAEAKDASRAEAPPAQPGDP